MRRVVHMVLAAAFLLVAATATAAPPANQQLNDPPADPSGGLADPTMRKTVDRLSAGQSAPSGVTVVGDEVRVEIVHSLGAGPIGDVVRDAGGTVNGTVAGKLTLALVPFNELEALERHAGIDYVRRPLRVDEPIGNSSDDVPAASGLAAGSFVGEEVSKTNAAAWQTSGWTGAGIKIGIIDGFDGPTWDSAAAADEVPAPAGTFCRQYGVACDIWSGGSSHGVGVAEIVHEMAPQAQIYLAYARSAVDLQAAEDFLDAAGVSIITRSLTAEYDGPGNGTGPIADVINNAVADGITWFNSAGNGAGSATAGTRGTYWRGSWTDADADGWNDFASGDELLWFDCTFFNGLRWSDWAATGKTNYDAYFFDLTPTQVGSSTANQSATGVPPIENPSFNCPSGSYRQLAIWLANPGSGTSGDVLEWMTNGAETEYWQNPFSASGPASDTASPGALSIGAIDPPMGTAIASYSSWGPTNDNRTKPDISAAACVASYTYAPSCFNGTSAATPAAAGAAALVLDAGVATTPAQVKTYVLGPAAVDRGAAGADNTYGKGELILPPPPASAPGAPANVSALAGNAAARVSWTAAAANGSPVTNYVVTPFIGATAQPSTTVGNVTSTTLNGLTNGTTYTFKVAARNAVGTGPQSAASNAVTPASTAYPRPQAASPLRLSLVPAFKQCTSPNSSHPAPLSHGSCVPPALVSNQLTVGTPDANGAAANSVASLKLSVVVGNPVTTADEADNRLTLSATDIRRKSNLADYTGELRLETTLRMTDKLNLPSNTNGGTLQDFPFSAVANCTATADTTVGSTCQLNTTLDTLVPGMVKEGARTVTHLEDVRLFDGGADSDGHTAGDNTLFAWEGVFTP